MAEYQIREYSLQVDHRAVVSVLEEPKLDFQEVLFHLLKTMEDHHLNQKYPIHQRIPMKVLHRRNLRQCPILAVELVELMFAEETICDSVSAGIALA
jgi:hypothetical protein